MIFLKATDLLLLCLIFLIILIILNCPSLQNTLITGISTFLQNTLAQNALITGISTGLGIIVGDSVINWFKYRDQVKDILKVFDLVVSNQIDDLYNIQIACKSIKNKLTTHTQTIIGSQSNPTTVVNPQRTVQERTSLLKDITKIKDRESTIRHDDLYKGKLNDVKLFKDETLETLVRYFRKLKAVLEDIRNFTFYELPSSIDDFKAFNSCLSETYIDRSDFLIDRINTVICLGLIAKYIFKSFSKKDQNKLIEIYKLLDLSKKIKDDNSIYSSLNEDFLIIHDFIKKLSKP